MARLLLRDLTPGTAYKLQLRAVDGDSVSEWSRRFDLTTSADTTAPDVPAWAVSNDWVVDGDTFVATWQALDFNLDQNKDFDHYEIELDDNTKQVVVRTNNTSYTLTFDQNRIFFGAARATVKARVRSVDAVGNASAWSAQKSATNPAPAASGSISVTALMESVKVDWAPVSDIDVISYKLQVSTTSASSGFSDAYNGPDNSFTYGTVMFATDHWFRVYAVDKFGSLSSATTSGSVRPKSAFTIDSTPPAAPASLTPTGGFDTTAQQSYIDLSWAPVADSDLDSYVIRYSTNGTNWQYINVPRENTTYRLNVDPGKSYYIAVSARDLSGNLQTTYTNASTYPITSTADTGAPSTPAVPTVAGNTFQTQVTITGNKSGGGAMEPDVAYYEVYGSTNISFTPAAANQLGVIPVGPAMVGTFITPTSGGTSNQTWYIKIIAVDKAGNKSAASTNAVASVPLIQAVNITDATITNAKISSLNADKITAGSGFINDITVKSKLTLGDASTVGYIETYDYTSSGGTSGAQFSKNGIIIKNGAIEAAALKIQTGENLMPAKYASFEHAISVYNGVDYGVYTFNDVRVLANAKFGTQVKRNGWVAGGAGSLSEIWMGTSATDYNIDVEPSTTYIVSAYVMKESGTGPSAALYMKGNGAGTVTAVSGASLNPITSTTTWTRIYGTWTSGASDTKAVLFSRSDASVDGAYFIDGIQVERKLGALTTPSPWTAPGSTSIDGGMVRTGSLVSTALAKDFNAADMSGLPAWSINTSGAAQFGDVLIRGRVIIGVTGDYENSTTSVTDADGNTGVIEDTTKLTGIGTIQSYNYKPGEAGWSIRSNGYAEFLQLKANSVSADAISAISPDKLNPGTMTSDIIIGTSIRSVEKDTLYVSSKSRSGTVSTLTLTGSHTRLVGDRIQVTLDPADAAFDTVGKQFATITAITDTTISYVSPSGSGTIGATATDGKVYVEGRSVVMSPEGLTLLQNDGIARIIDLPTDTLLPAYFAGDVSANSLSVSDYFLLQGQNNAVAAGAVFTLNASVVAPSGTPTLNFSWDYVSTWMTNDYSVWKSGLWLDAGRYITSNAFFGAQALGTNPDGSINFNISTADDAGGEGHVPYGIIKANDGKFYMLVNDSGDGLWKVRRYAASGNGFSTLEASWTYDEHTFFGCTATEWKVDGWNGSALKDPVLGYGTPDGTNYYLYIARCRKDGRIVVSRYSTTGTGVVNTLTNITDKQNLRSINVGNFDLGAYRWIVSTEGNSTKTATNYSISTSGTHQSSESFPSPNNYKIWGMCWNGSNFVTLTQNNRLYTHTSVALNGGNVWYVKATWFDGNNSRTVNVSAVSGNGTTATVTTSTAHGYVAGDIINLAGTLASGMNGNYYTIVTAPTTTTFTVSSSYSGSVGAGGTATNEWETSLGSYANATITRRAKMTVAVGAIPTGAGSNLPDRARFYFSNTAGGAGTYYRQTNSNASNSQAFTSSPSFSGSTGPQTAFPAGTPAKIVSNNGLLTISSDGWAIFGSTTDVNTNAGNTPALRVGDINGTHLRIDGNEIQGMSGPSTASGVIINQGGGNITFGNSSSTYNSPGYWTSQVRTQSDIRTNINGNTGGGLFDESQTGGSTVAANINTNGRVIRSSTIKMKENIADMTKEEAYSVLGLKSYTFEYKQDPNHPEEAKDPRRYPGFIAEQGAEVGAELWVARQHKVHRNPDGSLKRNKKGEVMIERDKNGPIVAFRTEAVTVAHNMLIKDLFAEIEALKAEIAELKK